MEETVTVWKDFWGAISKGQISNIWLRRFEIIPLSLLDKFLKATGVFVILQCCFKERNEVFNTCYLLMRVIAQRSFSFKDLKFNQKYLPLLFAASSINLQVLFIMIYKKSSQKRMHNSFSQFIGKLWTYSSCMYSQSCQARHIPKSIQPEVFPHSLTEVMQWRSKGIGTWQHKEPPNPISVRY